jgi:hypothetical protein
MFPSGVLALAFVVGYHRAEPLVCQSVSAFEAKISLRTQFLEIAKLNNDLFSDRARYNNGINSDHAGFVVRHLVHKDHRCDS